MKNFKPFQTERIFKFKFDENDSFEKDLKILWVKEKLRIVSNFFFSQCFQKTHENQGLFGKKGLQHFRW